jgi:hypothetical protein
MAYKPFGPDDKLFLAQNSLQTSTGISNTGYVYTVIGPNQGFYSWCGFVRDDTPNVRSVDWLRPVYDGEVYISNQVAFAHYDGCGHNIFFKYSQGFWPPSRCPRGDVGYLDEESVNIP